MYAPLAQKEYVVSKLAQGLSNIKDDTRSYVERKQTLTDKERVTPSNKAEDATEEPIEVQISDDEGDEGTALYNPLKLPMGWDGKPIPYWLFKLHGLGVQHPCEICGGYVYMGRKAFDRHFQEWRHTHGYRQLTPVSSV
jgi:splicing factor 3A subunit 3